MKLSNELVANLVETVRLATLFNVEMVKFTDDGVSGINDIKTIFMRQNKNIVDLPDGLDGIGLHRIPMLKSRINMLDPDNIKVTVGEKTSKVDGTYAAELKLNSGRVRTNFRCYLPSLVKTPKSGIMPDAETLIIEPELEAFLAKGKSVMKAGIVTIFGGSENITYVLQDVTNDKLEFTTDNDSDFIGDFSYDLNTMCILIKELSKNTSKGFAEIKLSPKAKGMLSAELLDYTIYVRAKAK